MDPQEIRLDGASWPPAVERDRDSRPHDLAVAEWTGMSPEVVRRLRRRKGGTDAGARPTLPQILTIWRTLGWNPGDQLLAIVEGQPGCWGAWFETWLTWHMQAHPELSRPCACGLCEIRVSPPVKWATLHDFNYAQKLAIQAMEEGDFPRLRAEVSLHHPEILQMFDKQYAVRLARAEKRRDPTTRVQRRRRTTPS